VQLALFALLWASNKTENWAIQLMPWSLAAYAYLVSINIVWALFNLLPIDPLDGGKVCREICELLRLRRPEVIALRISLGTALGVMIAGLILMYVPNTLLDELPWWVPIPSGLLCFLCLASLAYSSYERLRVAENSGYRQEW
jgi:Zn-dependent protease